MAWKTRNGRPYYYRSVRRAGRVRSEYVGNGPLAELASLVDRADKQGRDEAAGAWRRERAVLDAEDRCRAATFAAVEIIARIALELAGFHRHKRGEWRRRRMGDEATKLPAPAGMPGTYEEILDVVTRASEGDKGALPRLREMIRADPARMLKVTGAELADQVEGATIRKMAGNNVGWAEALPRKMKAIREELAGPGSSPIEKLLAERVALCWLDVHNWDLRHAQAEGLTYAQADHYQKMRDRASRRYLAALKTLAAVRKLGVFAVQVNIDNQQVNIGEG